MNSPYSCLKRLNLGEKGHNIFLSHSCDNFQKLNVFQYLANFLKLATLQEMFIEIYVGGNSIFSMHRSEEFKPRLQKCFAENGMGNCIVTWWRQNA